MKKFLWTIIVLAIAAGTVYLTTAKGKLDYNFFRFVRSGGFEAYFDEASKEIAENPNLSGSAHFTVSAFNSTYGNGNNLKNLIETEIRNSLSQILPGRVTSYRNFEVKGNNETAGNKNKTKTAEDKKTTANSLQENLSQPQSSEQESLINSGNFIISGTYKEEDGSIIVNLYVSDAENGRGYYARRISIPEEKLPELFKKKEIKEEKTLKEIIIPGSDKNIKLQQQDAENADNTQPQKTNIIEKINKAITNTKQEKTDIKENAVQSGIVVPIPAPASETDESTKDADPLEYIGNAI